MTCSTRCRTAQGSTARRCAHRATTLADRAGVSSFPGRPNRGRGTPSTCNRESGRDVTAALEARIRADVARLADDELESLATIDGRWRELVEGRNGEVS